MAKWKSQQFYTIQLQNVLMSIIQLVEDTNLNIGPQWYWGGNCDLKNEGHNFSGTIISVTEHVLPIIRKTPIGKMVAILPIQSIMEFEKETQLSWSDGMSLQLLVSKVESTYLAR